MEFRIAPFLLLLILVAAASANLYNGNGFVFDDGAVVNGTSGGLYNIETELGLIAGASTSTHYSGLYGLFLYANATNYTINITYPPNGTTFGPAQCWLLTNFTTTTVGGYGTVYLWVNSGTMAVPNWTLANSVVVYGSTVLNWTYLPLDSQYIINATYDLNGNIRSINQTTFWVVGIGLCPNHSNDSLDWGTLAFLILGSGLLAYGIYTW